MKETIFRFELRAGPVNPQLGEIPSIGETMLQNLNAKLTAVKGVLNIESEDTSFGTDLKVRVSFSDSDEAQKLLRKITRIIEREGVRISERTTTLTDIF